MNHKINRRSFGRKTGPRTLLLKGLVSSLVEYERVKTTLPKAKELRRHVEKAVTIAKKGTVHAQRNLLSKYPSKHVVSKLVNILGTRFKDTPGGYTRIVKLGTRPG